jgi:hypothetical protein
MDKILKLIKPRNIQLADFGARHEVGKSGKQPLGGQRRKWGIAMRLL